MTDGLLFHDEKGGLWHAAPPPIIAELRYAVARLQLTDGKSGLPPLLGVTAALSGEGTTFVSRSLAGVVADDLEEPTCLVDLNWWSNEPEELPSPGMAQIVMGEVTLDQVLVRTDHPHLTYLPAGPAAPEDRSAIARSVALKDVLDQLRERGYRLVLDVPPLLLTSDALTLTGYTEACMVVVRAGVTLVSEVREALDNLKGTAVMGIVLNQAVDHVPPSLLRRITPA